MINMKAEKLIQYLESSSMISQIKQSSNLVYPLDYEHIISKLMTSHETETVFEYLGEANHSSEYEYLQKLKGTISNYSFNPHKVYIPSNFFVENKAFEKLRKWLFPIAPNKKTLEHIGERGCGKTLTQNVFLNTYHEEMEKNNVFWVRCDIHKLYHLWLTIPRDSIDEKIFITIPEYLDMQLIYVFCKYLEESSLFQKIFNELIKSDWDNQLQLIEGRQVYQQDFFDKKFVKLSEELLRTRTNILNSEKSNSRNKKYSYALDKIMHDAQLASKPVVKNNWLLMSGLLQSFLSENHYYILFIADGADNIKLTSTSTYPLFKRVIKELSRFFREAPPNDKQIRYISIRKNTRAYLALSETTDTSDYIKDKDINKIHHDKNNIDKIFNARIEYVNKTSKKLLNEISPISNILEKAIGILVTEQKELFKDSWFLYENNIRCFLYNQIGLAELVLYRHHQLKQTDSFDIKKQIQNLFNRNLFLCGKLFLNSRETNTEIDQGDVFYNIFYKSPSSKEDDNCYLSLDSLRILQLLHNPRNSYRFYTEETITCLLNLYFDYDKDQVIKRLHSLVEASMIDCALDDDFDYRVSASPEKKLYYKLTPKGKYFLEELLSDIDVLYILSLDTYIPSNFIKKSFVDSFSNEINKLSFYRCNCIKSALAFLAFLIYSDKVENRRYINLFTNNKIDQMEYKKHIDEKTFDIKQLLKITDISRKINIYLNEIKNSDSNAELKILESFVDELSLRSVT